MAAVDLVAKLCPTLATPWTVACQAPLSMAFSRQEYWCGLPFPSPDNRVTGGLPNPGFKNITGSSTLWADSSPSEPPGTQLFEWQHTNIRRDHRVRLGVNNS